MRNSKIALGLLLAIAGCQSSGGANAPSSTPGPVVAAAQMPDFCRQQASQQVGASLENLSTTDPVATSNGTSIKGEWTDPVRGGDPVGAFECRFASDGTFQGLNRT